MCHQQRLSATDLPLRRHDETCYTLFTAGFERLVSIPLSGIYHIPQKCSAKHLVLCARFDPAQPTNSCPLLDSCTYVHADVSTGTECSGAHVNYAWRSLNAVTYSRFAAGRSLRVAPPSTREVIDVMDSSAALKTRALESKRATLQHCAHYYFDRCCDLGSECSFVHAVFIDPNARPFQRAPVPRQLGHGRELLLTKRQRAGEKPPKRRESPVQASEGLSSGQWTPSEGSVHPLDAHIQAARKPSASDIDVGSDRSAHSDPPVRVAQARTYRHNPYQLAVVAQ